MRTIVVLLVHIHLRAPSLSIDRATARATDPQTTPPFWTWFIENPRQSSVA